MHQPGDLSLTYAWSERGGLVREAEDLSSASWRSLSLSGTLSEASSVSVTSGPWSHTHSPGRGRLAQPGRCRPAPSFGAPFRCLDFRPVRAHFKPTFPECGTEETSGGLVENEAPYCNLVKFNESDFLEVGSVNLHFYPRLWVTH